MATADRLQLDKTWSDDGRLFASWRPPARRLLQQTRRNLHRQLRRSLHRACVHLKGHGGVKGALRRIMRQQGSHRYVARFDVARYYESIDHDVLLAILRQRGASAASEAVVADHLSLPDRHRSGRGMTAGGCLSLELMTESGAEFYEVEILTAGSQPTPVPELNWGQIKRG